METKDLQFGKVVFTEDGVMYKLDYTPIEELNLVPFSDDYTDKLFNLAKAFVRGRLNHCIQELEKHISLPETRVVADGRVFWKDGHFSKNAAELMQVILTFNSINIIKFNENKKELAIQIQKAIVFNNAIDTNGNAYDYSEKEIQDLEELISYLF